MGGENRDGINGKRKYEGEIIPAFACLQQAGGVKVH
jgi:hypothetical protein